MKKVTRTMKVQEVTTNSGNLFYLPQDSSFATVMSEAGKRYGETVTDVKEVTAKVSCSEMAFIQCSDIQCQETEQCVEGGDE